eukprot:6314861-Pyramimonas_sp.AAC.1
MPGMEFWTSWNVRQIFWLLPRRYLPKGSEALKSLSQNPGPSHGHGCTDEQFHRHVVGRSAYQPTEAFLDVSRVTHGLSH